jgi:hypothetical protein
MNEKLTYISKIAGMVTGVSAAIIIIWKVGTFVDNSKKALDIGYQSIENQNAIIKEQQKQAGKINDLQETIDIFYNDFKAEQIEANRWRKSYLQFVLDNTKSSDRLFRYIQGLNLENKEADTVKGKPDVKLKITPTK